MTIVNSLILHPGSRPLAALCPLMGPGSNPDARLSVIGVGGNA